MPGPNGGISHAEVRLGGSVVMMGEPRDPSDVTPAMLYVDLPDVDEVCHRALEAGGASLQEPRTELYPEEPRSCRSHQATEATGAVASTLPSASRAVSVPGASYRSSWRSFGISIM
jgi:hypothetical protein